MSKSILGYAVVVLLAVSGIASAMKPSTGVAENLSAVKSVKASVEARKQLLDEI